ncbi:response regulator [Pararhizobium sp. DWP1-1-3]|uniref:response regulator n=1 Tax=Pararhizobium sp. DWP1-1-3 TaxID=2804652 RepID=UPI003CF90813
MISQDRAEGRQVLVVEDEMTIVLVIEDALLGMGAQVVGPASRLDAAIRLAKEAPIDAAILDVNIRGGNSYEVADILASRDIPFLLCSGYSDWAIEERHRDRPRLTKPYSSNELKAQLLQLLNSSATG